MKKQTKIFLITVAVIVVLVVAYFYFSKPKQEPTQVVQTPSQGTTTTTPTPKGDDNFPLQKGSYGARVLSVQQAINRINPNAKIDEDKDFGNETYLALVTYVGTSFYPLTAAKFTELMNKSINKK